jgi:dTDP-4-amino-4,6-dideoxygalactose transaminase
MMAKIRLSKSVVGEEEKQALVRAIEAGYLGMGLEVQLFEEEIRQFLGTTHDVICVNTGTAALHLALQALGIGPGDEVLAPSLTYVATFQAISATGAKAVACDVNLERGFIDLDDAVKRLSPRTKAIVAVHYASSSEGMEAVREFAAVHQLRVIEDAAHSFGCVRGQERIGAAGDITCFSFDGIKNITSGEGGAVVTEDPEVARLIKDARLLGVEKDTDKRYAGQRSWTFDVTQQGWRYHMSNLMAAVGREQLKKLPGFVAIRRVRAQSYANAFRGFPDLALLDIDYTQLVPHIFPVRILAGKRDKVFDALIAADIECGIHYQPNHLLTYYRTVYSLQNTERLHGELLSLPLHPDLSETDQERVIETVKRALEASDA